MNFGYNKYDVAVIGGGPAGMMAAGRAAELGARVVLIEKNAVLGKKLLITGGGRCNITNAEFDVRTLTSRYGEKGKTLIGSFTRFGAEETFKFFEERGLSLKVEAEKRAFPITEKADDVLKLLLDYLGGHRVEIVSSDPVKEVIAEEGVVKGLRLANRVIAAQSYIVATGGRSRPETGSTGDGFRWMKSLGHSVKEPDPALVPVKVKDQWVKKLAGLSFPRARVSVFQDNLKHDIRLGKVLFTHFGLSGPLILNMSKGIADLNKYGPVNLEIDVYPDLDYGALDDALLATINTSLNKKVRNVLGVFVPARMVTAILELARVDLEVTGNALTREDRLEIGRKLKALPINVSGFLGVEKAIVTSGGVSLKEVDFKTMQSKLLPNLYLAGDILDFDRLSGGFSLQICWTTGFLAGSSAAKVRDK